MRKEFNRHSIQESVIHQLDNLSQFIDTLESMPTVQENIATAPDDVLMGRSLKELAMDDLMEQFAFITRNFDSEDIPIAIFTKILQIRDGEATGEDAAKQVLDELVGKFYDSETAPSTIGMPTFFSLIIDDLEEATRSKIYDNWDSTVHNLYQSLITPELINAKESLKTIQANLDSGFQTSIEKSSKGTSIKINNNDNNDKGEIKMNNNNQPPGTPGSKSSGDEWNTGSGKEIATEKRISPELESISQMVSGTIVGDGFNKDSDESVFGRDEEVKQLKRVLIQKDTPFALISGAEGIGKSAVVEALAHDIAKEDCPDKLKDAQIIEISLSHMMYNLGQQALGTLKNLVEAVEKNNASESHTPAIICISDFGNMGSQANVQMQQVTAMARDYLSLELQKGKVPIIIEASDEELFVLKSKSAESLKGFHEIKVNELSDEDTLEDLQAMAKDLAEHHGIKVSDDDLDYIIGKTNKFMPTQHQPGKAAKILEIAVADAEAEGQKTLNDERIDAIIAQKRNLPISFVSSNQSDRIDNLNENMLKEIFGQSSAVEKITDSIELVNHGLHDPKKPVGTFYLTGPTGVGKTELAKSLARNLFNDEDALIRINLSEFSEKHTVSRIIGSPPGYVGYGEKSPLQEVEDKPFSVVLFDEAEKAHPDVDNALMSLADEGVLNLMDGKKLDFRNCVVIWTSNLGAAAAEEAGEKPSMGFAEPEAASDTASSDAREAAAKARLKPEFRNRVTFVSLDYLESDSVRKIAMKEIDKVGKSLSDNKLYEGINLTVSEKAVDELMEIGYDRKFGARPMKRAIADHIKVPLGKWLKDNQDKLKDQFELVVTGVKDGFEVEINKGSDSKPSTPAPQPS